MSAQEFLLEVGVEEIPDWMIPAALADLEKRFLDALDKFELESGVTCRTDATPRRLTLIAEGLAAQQADRQETLSGPPKKIAFDAEGKPTKAALGFAKRAGVDVDALGVDADGKLSIERTIVGRPTREILAEVLPEIIGSIYFPKTMYWTGPKGPRFIRPIRSLVALLGEEVVPFEIAGVKAGNWTFGHRRLGGFDLEVSGPKDYIDTLRHNHVLLRADERRERIRQGCAKHFPSGGAAQVRENAKLLETLTYLTEYPTVIRGDFEPEYLELPDEVLETVMLVHQKYFAVEDAATGGLRNSFLAVVNLDGDTDGVIRQGHERVLRARFNDARFFFETDQKTSLADRVEQLGKVTFQVQLGSYLDKAERMRALVAQLADAAGCAEEKAHADRAALLAKCDLTTEMVGEFPELQGIVGGLYAAHQGEPSEVVDAIYDHYRPASASDEIPRTAAGRIVAIADKLDTLGGLFRLGLIPKGSRDPFALRRAAYGIVRICALGRLPLGFDGLCAMVDAGESASALREFFVDRLRYYLAEGRGFRYDEINAVVSASDDSPVDAAARAQAIAKVRKTPDFEPLAVSFKRIRNILEKAGGVAVYAAKELDEALLEAGAEKDLHDSYERTRREASTLKSAGDHAAALTGIASLRPDVDLFFDKVLVMAEDEKVRENRLTFLAQLLEEFSKIANFAEIVTE